METSSDLPIGSRLVGRYELGAVMGRGQMSTVYRARDTRLGRTVAIKVIGGTAGTVETLERQTSRTRIGTRLNHEGLVAVHDVHVGEDPSFLVMELVDGMALNDVLSRGGLLPDVVAHIGTKLCSALAAIHEAGVVHSDLEPSNVVLGKGTRPAVKLTDFGIARFAGLDRLTSTREPVGTARYLSPEQAAQRHFDDTADVYAAGLVLLECLTGKFAFPGTQAETIADRLARDPDIPASLGPEWVKVLRAMTAREPRARLSAEEASRELAALTVAPAPDAVGLTLNPVPADLITPGGGQGAIADVAPPADSPKASATAGEKAVAARSLPSDSGGERGLRRKWTLTASLATLGVMFVFGPLLLILSPSSTVETGHTAGIVDDSDSGQYEKDGSSETAQPEESDEPSPEGQGPAGEPLPPSVKPSDPPSDEPSDPPSDEPSDPPSDGPSDPPTDEPSDPPTDEPSDPPTDEPSDPPTDEPSDPPSDDPPPSDGPSDPPTDESG